MKKVLFLVAIFATFMAMSLTSCRKKEIIKTKIEETDLTIIHEIKHGSNEYAWTEILNNWILVDNDGNVISEWFSNIGNPFKNAHGVVRTTKGVYDCRNGEMYLIPIPHINVPKIKVHEGFGSIKMIENPDSVWQTTTVEVLKETEDVVLIFRKQGPLDGTRGNHYYEYNLITKELSDLKECTE